MAGILMGDARKIALLEVQRRAKDLDGFMGAYLAGSAARLSDQDVLDAASDVDVMVVLDTPRDKAGKARIDGVLIEITYLESRLFASPEAVLSNYHLADGLRKAAILADPTGMLTACAEAVEAGFDREVTVRARMSDVRQKMLNNLAGARTNPTLYDRASAWLFGAGQGAHVLLVAARQNPTVRKRYAAARVVCEATGLMDFYEDMLAAHGYGPLTRQMVEAWMPPLERAFDAAAGQGKTPFFFSTDISGDARPIAIGGSNDMIFRGLHREAAYWILATMARCMKILDADAPDLYPAAEADFLTMLGDMGVSGDRGIAEMADKARAFFPALDAAAEQVLRLTPGLLR